MASIHENLRNERNFLHKKRVQLPRGFFGTPLWPPFHCFGTPIWPPWRLIWIRSIWRIVGPRLRGRGWLYHYKKAGDLARRSLFLPSQLFVTHVTDSSPKGNPNAVFKLYHNPLLFTCASESLLVVSVGKFQSDLGRFILPVSNVSCLARRAQNAIACVACRHLKVMGARYRGMLPVFSRNRAWAPATRGRDIHSYISSFQLLLTTYFLGKSLLTVKLKPEIFSQGVLIVNTVIICKET